MFRTTTPWVHGHARRSLRSASRWRPPRSRHRLRKASRRTAAFGVAALALTASLTACGGVNATGGTDTTNSPQPVSLRVAFVPATTGLALQVAKAEGFFERNGISATLTPSTNISTIIPTLGKQYDISLGTATDLIRAGAAGLDVVQILGNTVSTQDNPFTKLIVRPNSGITSVAQLGGKRIGSPTISGVIHTAVLFWAMQNGVDPASIKGVQAPPPKLPDLLEAGRVDAVEALEPFASQLLKQGYVSLGDPFSPIADPLATNFWIANGTWARAHPDVVHRFAQSMKRAGKFIQRHPAEARQILQNYTNFPPQIASSVPLPTFNFRVRKHDLMIWERVLRKLGNFDGNVDVNELVLARYE